MAVDLMVITMLAGIATGVSPFVVNYFAPGIPKAAKITLLLLTPVAVFSLFIVPHWVRVKLEDRGD